MTLLWDVMTTLSVGFEQHDNTLQIVTRSSPRIILPQPTSRRAVQHSGGRANYAAGQPRRDADQGMAAAGRAARMRF